jgi:hypothetical protein
MCVEALPFPAMFVNLTKARLPVDNIPIWATLPYISAEREQTPWYDEDRLLCYRAKKLFLNEE